MELPVSGNRATFTPLSAKAFRRRVLRPVEGVFLFHPRALERLVHQHLETGLLARRVPALGYYLMPREVFLVALEDENPDALSVIEGLDLPDHIILLPMPLARQRVASTPDWLLHCYWARRFEAEVARAWQQAREDNRDLEGYGARGLERLVGRAALGEIREVLEQDELVVLEQDDWTVCRHFVGLVARLRYFAPGGRSFYFPAVRNWDVVDAWMASGHLDLPRLVPAGQAGTRLPMLMSRSRPAGLAGGLRSGPELPQRLEYASRDPDLTAAMPSDWAPHALPAGRGEVSAAATPTQRFARTVLSGARAPHGGLGRLRRALGDRLARWLGGLWFALPPVPGAGGAPGRQETRYRLGVFSGLVRCAARSSAAGRRLRSLEQDIEATWHYRRLCPGEPDSRDPVLATLAERIAGLSAGMAERCAQAFGLDAARCHTLEVLLRTLAMEQAREGRRSRAGKVLRHLDQGLAAGEMHFVRLRPLRWVRSLARLPLREPLPHQATLRTLRALDAARAQLDHLPWSGEAVLRYAAPVEAAQAVQVAALQEGVGPVLDQALAAAGAAPGDARQWVALAKVRAELLDLVRQRYHLRFSDLRDVIARNDLRLDDLGGRELLLGDRLGRLDRELARRLPGIYRRGEVYLKALQRLSAALSGTPWGRHLTRYGLLPFGGAVMALEVGEHLHHLFAAEGTHIGWSNVWTWLGGGLLLNAALYTEAGRRVMRTLWHGLKTFVSLVLFRGLRLLIQWEPVARLLRNPAVRELSRYLVEPLAIGLVALVPVVSLLLVVIPGEQGLPWEVVGLGFLVGNFLRNTQMGRRILDAVVVRLVLFWTQFRDTLVMGLFRLVVDVFGRLVDGVEQGLFRVEDLARYRAGEPVGVALLKSALRPVWGSLSYLIRFYVTVLVEPQINPIKHFPVVTVGHKLMLPALPAITTAMLAGLDPVLPRVVSVPFVTATVLLLPGFFGFLAWELKENWKLFAANHPDAIRPVMVGRHGESLRTLLRRGFHSGTIPRAFDKLRRRLRARADGSPQAAAALRRAEARVLEARAALERHRDRELTASLDARMGAGELDALLLETGPLHMATASVEMSVLIWPVTPDPVRDEPLRLTLRFSVEHGELLADPELAGPVRALRPAGRRAIRDEVLAFMQRSAAHCRADALERLLWLEESPAVQPGEEPERRLVEMY